MTNVKFELGPMLFETSILRKRKPTWSPLWTNPKRNTAEENLWLPLQCLEVMNKQLEVIFSGS